MLFKSLHSQEKSYPEAGFDAGKTLNAVTGGTPTQEPTAVPTPTQVPTVLPTVTETPAPTQVPTQVPTVMPTVTETPAPTQIPNPGTDSTTNRNTGLLFLPRFQLRYRR